MYSRKEKMVLRKAGELSAYLGIPTPTILFRDEETYHLGRAWARCFTSANTLRITLRGRSLKGLYHTIAHELLHIAFPKMDHGLRYEQYVGHLLHKDLMFDGRGLVTKIPKRKAFTEEIITALTQKLKRFDTKIKRLETLRRKTQRRLNRLKVKGYGQDRRA